MVLQESPFAGRHGVRSALVILTLTLIFLAAACGSEHPTAPRIATQPPTSAPTPQPTALVDWNALARLFDDPLFRDLARVLDDQAAASPINASVTELVAGIRGRNIDAVRHALMALPAQREAYYRRPSYHPRDKALLFALSLFEMRGSAYMPAPSLQRAEVSELGGSL